MMNIIYMCIYFVIYCLCTHNISEDDNLSCLDVLVSCLHVLAHEVRNLHQGSNGRSNHVTMSLEVNS